MIGVRLILWVREGWGIGDGEGDIDWMSRVEVATRIKLVVVSREGEVR